MRVAIVGSRSWTDLAAVQHVIETLEPDDVVISGGARGVDTMAVEAARARGLAVEVYPADWDRFGRSAGFRRNATIVERAERVVALWDGLSRGTAHTIRLAKLAGKPVLVVLPTPNTGSS